MVEKITHEDLGTLLKVYYEKKLPLFIWGTFGIGKSDVVKQVAKDVATTKVREFINWNKVNSEMKAEVLANPEKYFVLQDIRLSEYDSSDIKGLPDFTNGKRSIEFRVPTWALLLENPKSDGILFFDEINLATPLVVSSCYKIIYDRIVNDTKINDNWLILGCGNKASDNAFTHDVSPPLRDRGGEVELTFNTEHWINWAILPENNMCSEIIGYLSFKSGDLYKFNPEDEQKFTTPRGWARVNTLLKDIVSTKNYDLMRMIVCSAIGEGIGSEFVSYCKIKEQINLPELIKNPKKIADIADKDINIKFFVSTAVAEQYKDKKITFDKVLEVSKVLDSIKNAELVAYLWKLCSGYNAKKFKDDFVKKVDTAFAEKYGKYIIA
jgi:hypothetical protein